MSRRPGFLAVELPLVSFRVTYLDNTMLRSESTVRFRTQDELSANLHAPLLRDGLVDDGPEVPSRPPDDFLLRLRALQRQNGLVGSSQRASDQAVRVSG
jgi:hypothetical protein